MIRPLLRLAIAGLVAASGLAAPADSASPMPSAHWWRGGGVGRPGRATRGFCAIGPMGCDR